MKNKLSVIMVTRNAQDLLESSLRSINGLTDETIVLDAGSVDKTLAIARRWKTKIFHSRINHLGRNKSKALSKAKFPWVLMLDADEIISPLLRKEIKQVLQKKDGIIAYNIPFRNHYMGRVVRHGGEGYTMIRLFKRRKGKILKTAVHEKIIIDPNKTGKLRGVIEHFSYRSLWQMYVKFTRYALDEASEKFRKKEKATLRTIILNPVHMFWARFVEDKGYKDGFFRIPLDLGFAYMEFLVHLKLVWLQIKPKK